MKIIYLTSRIIESKLNGGQVADIRGFGGWDLV